MTEQTQQLTHNEDTVTEQNKVISLFQFIRELNKLTQKPILHIRDYPWSFALSDLPDNPEHIRVFWRDRVDEEAYDPETDNGAMLLSVHKPEFTRCPEPDSIFSEWLLPDWDQYRVPVAVMDTLPLPEPEPGPESAEPALFDTFLDSDQFYNTPVLPDPLPEQSTDTKQAEAEGSTFSDTDADTEPEPQEKPSVIHFQDDPARVSAYEQWLKERNEWAEKQKLTERTRTLFTDLYRMFFELQRESETKEIIVASGMLCDRQNPRIKHPVLTHRVKLDYDADTNTMYIYDTEASSELYSTVYQSMENINLSSTAALNTDLQNNDYHPLDRIETPVFLKRLVHQLSADSIYSEDGEPYDWRISSRLLLYPAPCYIVRKRLDGTLKAIEQIIENVEETGEIPAPISDIVSAGTIEVPEEVGEAGIEEQLAAVGGESVDILLSKEANKEQLEIARRIEQYNAVLVQGPPGTGKTHTIANLMGHFLAQGKSVLVTSHTSKALSVLKEKVAPGLQSLCVSVLDDSNLDMERSIDGITGYMSKTTSFELRREMDELAVERRDIINQLADIRRKIFAIISQECGSIDCGNESLSPSKAAEFVVDHVGELSYIPGRVRLRTSLPLSFEQLTDLYRSNEGITAQDEEELAKGLPDPAQLMSPADYAETWEALQAAQQQLKRVAELNQLLLHNDASARSMTLIGPFGSFTAEYPSAEAVQQLQDYARSFGTIEKWMKAAAVDGKRGTAYRQRWDILMAEIRKTNDYAESVMAEQFGHTIVFDDPQNKEPLKAVYEQLKALYTEKGKISKLTLALHREYGAALEAVKLDGRQPQSAQDCELVLHCIELDERRRQCAAYWDQLLSAHEVPKFFELDTEAQEQTAVRWVPIIETYLNWYASAYQPLLKQLTAIGIPADLIFAANPLDSELVTTDKILTAVGTVIPAICELFAAALRVEAYDHAIDEVKAVLLSGQRGSSRLCAALMAATESGSAAAYAEAYAELEQLYAKYDLQRSRTELLNTLEPVAPQWAEAIRSRTGVHGSVTVPSDIEDAWKWKQLSGIIEEITAAPFSQLQADSVRLSQEYRAITARYAEKSGWYHLLRRTETNKDMQQDLQGWRQTVRKIGKGTGKRAPALKAEARRLMASCQTAVPCWIMTINRALESLDPKTNRFDIIIIDEASQSDISSMAILYMGRKLIIVGDDNQVSPMAIGVDVTQIASLQEMYLRSKIKNSTLFDAETSLYDISATTFQPLMLREHFRCVPEIIGFSNMLSYDNRIKPLRDASSSSLLPAVVPYRVEAGSRDKSGKTNLEEARTVVALLRACMEQPEYDGKSFGIISLLGDEQVKVIQTLIEQELSPREIISRKILCGNSANFQGDERDVIFLSLVDSGTGNGPLSLRSFGARDAYRKRYNVAASRARDQLWVVHSLDPATDLKPGDIRKTLIEYAVNPQAADGSSKADDQQEESPFEAAVAAALTERGYHIQLQWTVGAYHLDMVAVCGKKMVAVECDGERWYSGESKIREDMERQTILERLGWRFIRIRGSEYFTSPEKALDRVATELAAYGIEPEAPEAAAPEAQSTELLHRVTERAALLLQEDDPEEEEPQPEVTALAVI